MFPYCSRHEQATSPTATVRILLLPEDPHSNPIIGIFRTSITVKTVEQTRIRKRGLECPIKKHANNAVNLSKVFYYIFSFFKIKFPVNGSREVGGQHFWWILWSLMHKICTCAAVAFTRWKLLKSFSSVWIVLNQ